MTRHRCPVSRLVNLRRPLQPQSSINIETISANGHLHSFPVNAVLCGAGMMGEEGEEERALSLSFPISRRQWRANSQGERYNLDLMEEN